MAMDLGITAGAYAKIERGETDPSATRLLEIAEILEVDVTVFFRDNTPAAKFEDPGNQYGFATKQDVEKLTHLMQQMNREIEKLKSQNSPKKKTAAKKRK